MKINYDLINIDYASKSIILKDNYIEITSLDGSVTKIDINYLPEKYVIKKDEDESLL